MAHVNQVRNPSAEYGVTAGVATSGYTITAGATVTQSPSTFSASYGTKSFQVAGSAGGTGIVLILAGTWANTDRMSVQMIMKGNVGGEVVGIFLAASDGSAYSNSPLVNATLTSSWLQYSVDVPTSNSWSATFTGKTIGLVLQIKNAAGTFFVDGGLVFANDSVTFPTTFFDGDIGGTWNGTPGDSASTQTAAGAALTGTAAITTTATGVLASSALTGSAVIVTAAFGGLVQPPTRFLSQPATAQPSLLQPATIPPMIALTGGAAAIVTAASGSARTAAVLAGAAAVTTTATGIVIARPVLSGAAAVTTTASALVSTPGALSGVAVITTAASGTLVAPSVLLGVSAIQTSASVAVNAAGILAGTAVISTTATGTAASPPPNYLSGLSDLATSTTGAISTPAVLTGVAAIQIFASGVPTAQLAGNPAVSTTATGVLSATTLLSSTATITTLVSGVLTAQLSGAAQISISSTGSFTTTAALQGEADLATAATGSLPNIAALTALSSLSTTTTGVLSVLTGLTGTASTTTTTTGILTTALTPGYIVATDVLSGDGQPRDAYEPDNFVTLTANVYRIGGTPQDPLTLTLEVLNPTQTIVSYTTLDMTHTAPGVYSIMILISTPGQWEYEFSASGPTADTGDQSFFVLPSLL